jgi:hypothetical protein
MELPLITIDRIIKKPFGVYGLLESGDFNCFTIERPWLGNTPWLSCIPPGLYFASRGEFSRGRPPYPDLELSEVSGRSGIEIHGANMPSQLNGCIAPAEYLKWVDGEIHGTSSKHTLSALLGSFDTDDVWVLIRES